jgi:hypothetical protein
MRGACEAVQAAAPKGRAAIRRMLTAEFQARDFSLPPELFEVLVKQLAAGTYTPGEPLVSGHRSGLLRVPFIGKAIRRQLGPMLAELAEHVPVETFVGYGAPEGGGRDGRHPRHLSRPAARCRPRRPGPFRSGWAPGLSLGHRSGAKKACRSAAS